MCCMLLGWVVPLSVKRRMYQREVGVDMLKSLLAEVSSVSPSSEQITLSVSLMVKVTTLLEQI